jgi:hypothetical protein
MDVMVYSGYFQPSVDRLPGRNGLEAVEVQDSNQRSPEPLMLWLKRASYFIPVDPSNFGPNELADHAITTRSMLENPRTAEHLGAIAREQFI